MMIIVSDYARNNKDIQHKKSQNEFKLKNNEQIKTSFKDESTNFFYVELNFSISQPTQFLFSFRDFFMN